MAAGKMSPPTTEAPNGFSRAMDLLRTWLPVVVILIGSFLAYLHLAEDRKAVERWNSRPFEERVAAIARSTHNELGPTRSDLVAHQSTAGHSVMLERVARNQQDIVEIKDTLKRIEDKISSVASALISRGVID